MARTPPKTTIKQALTYRFERLLVRGPFYRVLAIWGLILIIEIVTTPNFFR